MTNLVQKVKESLGELNEDFKLIAIRNLELRTEGLRKAVEEGWFKYVLIGGGLVGAALTYDGLANGSDVESGIGYGMLTMASLQGIILYGLPDHRNRKNQGGK